MGDAVLLAGATGAVGTVLLPILRAGGFSVIPHVRPRTAEKHPAGRDGDALICELSDSTALDAAMAKAGSVVCLVGTMRRRFSQGDTYQSSDYQPVVQLVESARRLEAQKPSARPRHFVLLSAYGARNGNGYLGWKWRAEEMVRASGLPYTIVRPSAFDSRGSGANPSDGKARTPPPLFGPLVTLAGMVPGLRGLSDDLRPIPLVVLARAIERIVRERAPVASILTGRTLWQAARL